MINVKNYINNEKAESGLVMKSRVSSGSSKEHTVKQIKQYKWLKRETDGRIVKTVGLTGIAIAAVALTTPALVTAIAGTAIGLGGLAATGKLFEDRSSIKERLDLFKNRMKQIKQEQKSRR